MEGTSEHFFSITEVPEELDRYLAKVREFVAKHVASGTPIVLVTVRSALSFSRVVSRHIPLFHT